MISKIQYINLKVINNSGILTYRSINAFKCYVMFYLNRDLTNLCLPKLRYRTNRDFLVTLVLTQDLSLIAPSIMVKIAGMLLIKEVFIFLHKHQQSFIKYKWAPIYSEAHQSCSYWDFGIKIRGLGVTYYAKMIYLTTQNNFFYLR